MLDQPPTRCLDSAGSVRALLLKGYRECCGEGNACGLEPAAGRPRRPPTLWEEPASGDAERPDVWVRTRSGRKRFPFNFRLSRCGGGLRKTASTPVGPQFPASRSRLRDASIIWQNAQFGQWKLLMPDEDRKTEKIYCRITPELLVKLRVAAAHRHLNQPDAIAEAIERWVEEPATGITLVQNPSNITENPGLSTIQSETDLGATLGPLTPEEVAYIAKVLRIDRSTVPGPNGLRLNVDIFEDYRELHERTSSDTHPVSEPSGTGTPDEDVDRNLDKADEAIEDTEGFIRDTEEAEQEKIRPRRTPRKGSGT